MELLIRYTFRGQTFIFNTQVIEIILNMKYLPLATVQAALGPVALDSLYNSGLDPNSELYQMRKELGLKVLTIAVLVIFKNEL